MVLKKEEGGNAYHPKIYYVGVFDYSKLVKTMANWMNEQGYEFQENVYKHKVPSPLGVEQEFKTSGWRKVTEYVMYWVHVHAHIWELKEIDVMVDGKKKRMARGKIQLTFKSEVWLDYNKKFNGPVAERIQKFLHDKVWYKQITGGWTDECYYRMYKLHKAVKIALNMSTPTNAADIRY